MLLKSQHNHTARKWRAHFYSQGNKAGKLLANQVKENKQKIPFIYHPNTGIKRFNPKEIANAFRDYYNTLYNLKDDSSTPQPSPEVIQDLLESISFLKLVSDQLKSLNEPISIVEIQKTIMSLPKKQSSRPGRILVLIVPHITLYSEPLSFKSI